jgi:drug/metabolite transporter (DMT)-like permease
MPAAITPLSRPNYLIGAAWGLFAISIWVGWILLTRYGVTTSLSPFDITALRFACAGILLAPIVIRDGFGIGKIGLKTWLIICIGAGVPYVLIASGGLQFAPAAHAGALIPGTMPLWAALLFPAREDCRFTQNWLAHDSRGHRDFCRCGLDAL